VEAVLKTRTYANLSWETVLNLARQSAESQEPLHPLLVKRPIVKRVAVVIIASNRGLCGGFNSSLLNKVRQSIKKHETGEIDTVQTEFIILGKKSEVVARWGYEIAAQFPKYDVAGGVGDILPAARLLKEKFLSGYYDKIMVAYNDFISAAKQVPRVRQLLPVEIDTKDEFLGVVGKNPKLETKKDFIAEKSKAHLSDNGYRYEYLFEPNRAEVLNKMLPRLIEVQLYQSLLESDASEHSARMSTMHQAQTAAGDMVSELTLFYNKARQAGITAEIAEISAGTNEVD